MTERVCAWHLDQFKCRVDEHLVLANATLDISIIGKVTCIVGPNGGGKSTLVKLFTGHLNDTRFRFEGDAYLETVDAKAQTYLHAVRENVTPSRISQFGVEYVSQEPSIPAYANWKDVFVAGLEGPLWLPPRAVGAQNRCQKVAGAFGIEFHPQKPKGDWARADLQRFAILRALTRLPKGGLLVFDEASASLPDNESTLLLTKLRDHVRAEELSLVFVSHRPSEIALADQVIEVHLGRVFEAQPARKQIRDARLSSRSSVRALELGLATGQSVTLRQGEVARLQLSSAAAENALLDALASRRNSTLSHLVLFGVDHMHTRIHDRRRAGLRLIPGDRTNQGIFGDLTAKENIAVGGMPGRELALVDWRSADERGARFSVSTNHMVADARHLSGGFKQRVLFARELDPPDARVLVAFNALQGLDISIVPKLIEDLHAFAAEGGSVLLVGSA